MATRTWHLDFTPEAELAWPIDTEDWYVVARSAYEVLITHGQAGGAIRWADRILGRNPLMAESLTMSVMREPDPDFVPAIVDWMQKLRATPDSLRPLFEEAVTFRRKIDQDVGEMLSMLAELTEMER
jgi:hypothetical protein